MISLRILRLIHAFLTRHTKQTRTKPMISLRILGLIRRDDEILMVKPRASPEPNVWDLPGGGIHFREPHIEALTREMREEVGLYVKAKDPPLVVSDFIPQEDKSRHSVNIVFECVPLDSGY